MGGHVYLPDVYYRNEKYVYYFESEGVLGGLDNVTYVEERSFDQMPSLSDIDSFNHKVTGRYWYAENGDLIAESLGTGWEITYFNEDYANVIEGG